MITTLNRFRIVELEEASPEVKAIYNETMQELGLPFVLNWFKCQGGNAILLRGNWEKLRATMLKGNVPFILKQLIIYNISKQKGCSYCAHVHGLIADSLSDTLTGGEKVKLTENLQDQHIPSSYKVAMQVVTKCALAPAKTTEEDFEKLRETGFTDSEVQELFSLADLTNMVNTIADISGIRIDNELMEPK